MLDVDVCKCCEVICECNFVIGVVVLSVLFVVLMFVVLFGFDLMLFGWF